MNTTHHHCQHTTASSSTGNPPTIGIATAAIQLVQWILPIIGQKRRLPLRLLKLPLLQSLPNIPGANRQQNEHAHRNLRSPTSTFVAETSRTALAIKLALNSAKKDNSVLFWLPSGDKVALIVWNLLAKHNVLPNNPDPITIIHFLWALLFLKIYPREK